MGQQSKISPRTLLESLMNTMWRSLVFVSLHSDFLKIDFVYSQENP